MLILHNGYKLYFEYFKETLGVLNSDFVMFSQPENLIEKDENTKGL